MENLQPRVNCSMNCHLRGGPRCVCNLIAMPGESAPISYGLRLGLNHFYGEDGLPPCVRGPLGATYWSVKSTPGDRPLVWE